jgi:hypothetical protein
MNENKPPNNMQAAVQNPIQNPIHLARSCLAYLRSMNRQVLHVDEIALIDDAISGLVPLENMLYYTGATSLLVNGTPRRCQLNHMIEAELAIRAAINQVEELGCDVRLTNAVVLLSAAHDRVADFVDKRTLKEGSPVKP